MDEYLLPQFQVNEAYRPQKRKRGGLAGIWDRNKGVITPLATLAAGALGGPAAATALGAAMGGLDRPGKRGIGLDAGGAVRGGLQGYTMGRVGQYGAGKLKGLFAPTPTPPAPVPAAPTPEVPVSATAAPVTSAGGGMPLSVLQNRNELQQIADLANSQPLPTFTPSARLPLPTMPAPTPMPTPSKFSLSGLFKPGGLIYENPEVSAGIAQGLIGAYGSAQEREMERELINRQRAQQERLAALLMPMYTQYGGFGG